MSLKPLYSDMVDLGMFGKDSPGSLVDIAGTDPVLGPWVHKAFVPNPLADLIPTLEPQTYLAVADARAALASLDTTASQLPNPTLLRSPALRLEAQSTSALEGTYAPIAEVLVADEDEPTSAELVEILNYVRMANHAFAWVGDGRPITTGLLEDLQGILMRGTALEAVSGRIRDAQVVIGRRAEATGIESPVHAAKFVPAPPGHGLEGGLADLTRWISEDRSPRIDPVIAAAMSHYQFEALHPFRDGNGRVGRLLIVLHLQRCGALSEPTLTVSRWFEGRRREYYDRLLCVSTRGDWDGFVRFFAHGLREAATVTRDEMLALVGVQAELKERLRSSTLRASSAYSLVDLAVANPTFTVRRVAAQLSLSYGRANKLVGQLVDLGILAVIDPAAYKRRFCAPRVIEVLSRRGSR